MKEYVVSIFFIIVATFLFVLSITTITGEFSKVSVRESKATEVPATSENIAQISESMENLTQEISEEGTEKTNLTQEVKKPKVIINEIMYNPKGRDDGREWIEIFNSGNADANLSGWKLFEDGVNHKLVFFGLAILPSNSYGVITTNITLFLTEYPNYEGILIKSRFSLSNTGETIALKNENGEIVDEVNYSSSLGANGNGKSLERKDNNWLESYVDGGTPGRENSVYGEAPKVLIEKNITTQVNETNVTYVNVTLPQNITQPENITEENITENVTEQLIIVLITKVQVADNEFIELYNPTDNNINMSGWYLSYFPSTRDWNNSTRNWEFLSNATIPAKGFFLINIFNSTHLNPDWTVLTEAGNPYSTGQLSNTAGSIAIFPFNPKTKTAEEAKNGRVDAVGWGNVSFVFEGSPAQVPPKGKILSRIFLEDTNDNANDFNVTEL